MSHRKKIMPFPLLRSVPVNLRRACPYILLLLPAMAWAQQDAVVTAPADAPDALSAQLLQVRELATGGQRAAALARYDQLLLEHPDNSDVLLARGRTHAWEGNHAQAEADLRAVVQASPRYADAWSALGDLYWWSDRPQQAADAYGQWIALEPEQPRAWIARGRAWRAAGENDAAAADFSTAAGLGADVESLQESLRPQVNDPDAMMVDGYRWSLRAGIDHTRFSGGRDAWNDVGVTVRRRFERGSLGLEMINADHFQQRDTAWALDGYVSLWERAYANVRYQHGPDSGILPRHAGRVELFQGVGSGWELSASVDYLRFSGSTEFYGLGIGRYSGNWYTRYKLQHVPGVGSGSWSHRLQVRNYYRGNADDYLQLSLSSGRSTDVDRFGGVVRDNNAAIGVSWTRYVTPRWGFKVGAGYADSDDGFNQQELSFALHTRW
jgi:YaiO family outer membrane protein